MAASGQQASTAVARLGREGLREIFETLHDDYNLHWALHVHIIGFDGLVWPVFKVTGELIKVFNVSELSVNIMLYVLQDVFIMIMLVLCLLL